MVMPWINHVALKVTGLEAAPQFRRTVRFSPSFTTSHSHGRIFATLERWLDLALMVYDSEAD